MFLRTTVINKVLGLTKFTKGIQGGTSAGKTFGILPILIDLCCKTELLEISVVAESIPTPQKRGNKRLQKNNGVNRSMESKPMERD
jgi:phage terminase large subunit